VLPDQVNRFPNTAAQLVAVTEGGVEGITVLDFEA
jgi:hypothetical protein